MEQTLQATDMAELTAKFINTTSKNIFLTGKAGTGKTTFLHQLRQLTHKRFIVTAPTGIAALNAGGVTLHSQFLLPLGSYVPDSDAQVTSGNFFNSNYLARRNPLNADRKKILREIDLLVIDEVSMLRADILDSIDYRLRAARRDHTRPFGGVQLLLIGDMFQLPPVVKNHEIAVMRQFYPSLYFFESIALKKSDFIYIEFEKVYRQSDTGFIGILNRLRTNATTHADIDRLNERYLDGNALPENTITLTTHNYQADDINQRELAKLPGKAKTYTAEVQGKFPESMYPLDENLVLKENARVMFIKNDPEGRFYNGKIATITDMRTEYIRVKLSGEDLEIDIEPMQWRNSKYQVDETTNELNEETIGSFTQFPFKYAWAVTVHKSQGLTFSRAVIDVGRAFAPGQVYVALSRLQSLEGLFLRTRIDPASILNDSRIRDFAQIKDRQPPASELLSQGQAAFVEELLASAFDFRPIIDRIEYVDRKKSDKLQFPDPKMSSELMGLKMVVHKELGNTGKFRRQLASLLAQGEREQTIQRATKGSTYYTEFLFDVLEGFLLHREKVERMSRVKAYTRLIGEIDHTIMQKIGEVQRIPEIAESILQNRPAEDFTTLDKLRIERREAIIAELNERLQSISEWQETSKKPKKKKGGKGKVQKGATYTETFNLIKDGMSIEQVAVKRSLAHTTIEGHVARCIADGRLSVDKFLEKSDVEAITETMKEVGFSKLTEVHATLNGEYSYGKLRMVQSHLQHLEQPDTTEQN